MVTLGNIFTHYRYGLTDIQHHVQASQIQIISETSDLDVVVDIGSEEVPLPPGSPFTDWKEARRFAGPLPHTFSYDASSKEVLIIEGVREFWQPRPVQVLRSKVGFMERPEFAGAMLASAFIVQNIPYHWKKGRTEIWQG